MELQNLSTYSNLNRAQICIQVPHTSKPATLIHPGLGFKCLVLHTSRNRLRMTLKFFLTSGNFLNSRSFLSVDFSGHSSFELTAKADRFNNWRACSPSTNTPPLSEQQQLTHFNRCVSPHRPLHAPVLLALSQPYSDWCNNTADKVQAVNIETQ